MLAMWRIGNGMASNLTKEQIGAVYNQVVNHLDISRKATDSKLLQQDSDAVQQRFLRENKLKILS